MCATSLKSTGTVLLYDVPWKTYERLTDALAERHFRHTYQEGTLEIFSSLVRHVTWTEYEKVLKAFGDKRFRHTYQEGTLEIMMSPSDKHEYVKSFLGRVVEAAAMEHTFRMRSVGSATRRDKKLAHGLEPDESYHVDKSPRTSKKTRPALQKTTAPDLVIEVDMRKMQLERLESFAKLQVGEVWRYFKGAVEILRLTEQGAYESVKVSGIFPEIAADDLTTFVARLDAEDETDVFMDYLDLLRKRIAKHKS